MAASTTAATKKVRADAPVFTEGEAGLDAAWLGGVLGIDDIESAKLEDFGPSGGSAGHMRRIVIARKGGAEGGRFLLKTTTPGGEGASKALGTFRESLFFQEFAPELRGMLRLPEVQLAHANADTGFKALIMEDLTGCIETGLLFGPFSPLNAGRDLEGAVERSGGVTPARVAAATALAGARLHAKHWGDASLTARSWLRGSQWALGEGREAWEASQGHAAAMWTKAKGVIAAGGQPWWDSRVVDILDASFAKVSWADQVARMTSSPWTLVHGDFHPGNFMWDPSATGADKADPAGRSLAEQAADDVGRLVVLDMEVVGVGSGPQDLGQYAVSHADPAARRGFEDDVVALYHAELVRCGVDGSSFGLEACREEYVRGGSERWMWLLAYIAGVCPEPLTHFLHDQVLAFCLDHGVTPETVGQPRS